MRGTNTGRVHKLAGAACAAIAALLLVACAASTTMSPHSAAPDMIEDVRVESHGEATTVTLLGLGEPVFTAFAQRNPERVIVDIVSATPDDQIDTMAVQDGLVDEVRMAPYMTAGGEPMTRVEVMLSAAADYEVLPTSEGLMIRIAPDARDAADGDEMAAAEIDPWDVQAEDGDEVMAEAPAPSTPATQLNDVRVTAVGEGSLVHLIADGTVASAESFTLDNPNRLVIDLPGMKSTMQSAKVDAGTPQASQVRVGQHADMVRVVIDGGDAEEPFAMRRVMPAASGLLIALGAGEELEMALAEAAGSAPMLTAMPEAAEEMPEAAPMAEIAEEPVAVEESTQAPPLAIASSQPVVIYGVEFDSQIGRDRIVILGERPVEYIIFEPSPETVIVSIQNATIDPEAAVRIAPESGGPISLVTAFEQPESDGSEVRIVMTRAAGLKPEVSRRGSLVVIDFPRDGQVAQAPPVMTTEPAMPEAAPMLAPEATAPVPATGSAMAQPAAAMPAAPVSAPVAPISQPLPAAIGSQPAIEVLQEGGLIDGKEYVGRRISLDFKDIEMADVLRLIAEVSDLNVVAGDEVQGKVTIRLVDVPWDQALDVILLTKGLGFMRVGNVLRIAPSDLLRQEEEMRLQERRALEELEDLIVKLQPVNYATASDMRSMVSRLLTSRGTVDIDKRTNTLIIKDIPSVIDEATALVKAVDTQTPQVLIEAKIVEANLDFSREFGVVWGVGAQPISDIGNDSFRLDNSGLGNNANFSNPLTAGPTSLFNLAGFILDDKINLELQLQAAEVNGDGKVISSPRVVTLDNSKATIEQGVSIPFQTFENGDAQLEFVDAVLKLEVTPHVTADRSIIMDLNISRNAPDDSVFTLTGSPAIAKNQVDTETLVKDGQTLVVGGIYVIDKSERQSRVPFLHSVPIIGTLFRSDEMSDSRKELLIFVTPRVVDTQQQAAAN